MWLKPPQRLGLGSMTKRHRALQGHAPHAGYRLQYLPQSAHCTATIRTAAWAQNHKGHAHLLPGAVPFPHSAVSLFFWTTCYL